MANGVTYSVKFRRKRQQKTDYKKRLNLLKSEITRLVVRPSNKNMVAQLVNYDEDGDRILLTATTAELKKMGWTHSTSNTPAAYLTGLLCGVKGKAANVDKAILDTGLHPHIKGSKIYAALKGFADSGVEIPFSEEIVPDVDRISGKTISGYVERSKSIVSDFEKMKDKILKSSK